MNNLKLAYLFGSFVLLVPWLILYYRRADLRKQMIFFSILSGMMSLVGSYVWWTVDWWHPQTVTGTRTGVEDVLIGFASGGIASAIYEEVFRLRVSKRRKQKKHGLGLAILILLTLSVIAILFWQFHSKSFWSLTIAMLIGGVLLVGIRRDLANDALMSGVLTVIASLPFYFFIMLFSPGWIDATYDKTLSGIRVLGIPIEEYVFYFFWGFCIGPAYAYWEGGRMVHQTK